jgi:hypothetical protein
MNAKKGITLLHPGRILKKEYLSGYAGRKPVC